MAPSTIVKYITVESLEELLDVKFWYLIMFIKIFDGSRFVEKISLDTTDNKDYYKKIAKYEHVIRKFSVNLGIIIYKKNEQSCDKLKNYS